MADYITVPINNAELEEAIKKIYIEIIKLKDVKRSFYNKLQSPPPVQNIKIASHLKNDQEI